MAKFCKYCGSPLEEGQVCGCPGAQAAVQAAAAPQAAPQAPTQPAAPQAPVATAAPKAPGKAAALFNDLKDVLLANLKGPAQAEEKLLASPFKYALSGMMAGLNFLVIFFLLWRVLASLVGSVVGAAGAFIKIGYPILPMLVSALAIVVLFVGLYGGALFLKGKLAKVNIDILDALVVAGGYTLIPSALLIVAILMSFLSLVLCLVFVVAAIWVWLICMNGTARERTQVVAITDIKQLGLQMALRLVVGLLVAWLTWVLLKWCFTSLSINGVKLSDVGNLLGGLFG